MLIYKFSFPATAILALLFVTTVAFAQDKFTGCLNNEVDPASRMCTSVEVMNTVDPPVCTASSC